MYKCSSARNLHKLHNKQSEKKNIYIATAGKFIEKFTVRISRHLFDIADAINRMIISWCWQLLLHTTRPHDKPTTSQHNVLIM